MLQKNVWGKGSLQIKEGFTFLCHYFSISRLMMFPPRSLLFFAFRLFLLSLLGGETQLSILPTPSHLFPLGAGRHEVQDLPNKFAKNEAGNLAPRG